MIPWNFVYKSGKNAKKSVINLFLLWVKLNFVANAIFLIKLIIILWVLLISAIK